MNTEVTYIHNYITSKGFDYIKETFKVYYNSFKYSNSGSKTKGSKKISQKPDNLLAIDKLGSEKAYEYVFDAKYKIDISKGYQNRCGGIGPKEEDINTMHQRNNLQMLQA